MIPDMTLTALRCPNCSALLPPEATTVCSYCGATLVPAEPAARGPRIVSVYLDSAGTGDDKIAVIQVVFRHLRDHLNIGLKASKDLVDGAPCVLVKDVSESLAEPLVTAMRAAKATVRIV